MGIREELYKSLKKVISDLNMNNFEFEMSWDEYSLRLLSEALVNEVNLLSLISKAKESEWVESRWCPECGCNIYVNKNLLGDGFRQCKCCGQEWWTDVKYTEPVREYLVNNEKPQPPKSEEGK